jgi:M6 family metalloprotease-like protein
MVSKKLIYTAAFAAFLLSAVPIASAAPLFNVPVEVKQPDGTVLHLFASGDEYCHRVHDAEGYTVIRDPVTAWIVYADQAGDRLEPTPLIAGLDNPSASGLRPGLRDLHAAAGMYGILASNNAPQTVIRTDPIVARGLINSLVIFIRFSDETEFPLTVEGVDGMFNSTQSGTNSLRNYFTEASYGLFTISSTYYPPPASGTVVSFKDTNPRAYYQPYSTSNPTGYNGQLGQLSREMDLLSKATDTIKDEVPKDLNIDVNNDGYVDSVVFVVRGSVDGWAELLWPHMSTLVLMSKDINGKIVNTYSFQLENSLDTGVLAHEGFHAVGSPDLYHYSYDGLSPAYKWDLMERDANPPEHMSSYMKYRFGNWITSIPVIDKSGTYTLNPLGQGPNAYKLISPHSTTEYFVVEYRSKTGAFESSVPGSGLLVWRVNSSLDGSGNSNGPPDELYVLRPGGTPGQNGTPENAYLSLESGRTAVSDTTNPYAFFSDGRKAGIYISAIGSAGSSIQFTVCVPACDGKVCGPDGCGGECGHCFGSYACTAAGQCVDNCDMSGSQTGAYSPMANYCSSSQGRSAYLGAQAYKEKWKYSAGEQVLSPTTVDAQGTVYFGTSTKVHAVLSSGTKKWIYSAGGEVRSAPAIASDGTVYAGDSTGALHAIDGTGANKWTYTADSAIGGVSIGPDGAIYIGTANGTVYAVEKTNSKRWSYSCGGAVNSKVTIGADGIVYAGAGNSTVCAITAEGKKKWDAVVDGAVSFTPAVSLAGGVFATTQAGSLYHVDGSGTVSKIKGSLGVPGGPAVSQDGTVVVGSADKKVYDITTDGTVKWTFITTNPANLTPFVGADGTVYAADCATSASSKIYGIKPDGTQKWSATTGDCNTGHPSTSPGLTYAGSRDKYLYAIGDTCVPQCYGRQCGPNGCGGECGGCALSDPCMVSVTCDQGAGKCVYTYKPDDTTCKTSNLCLLDEKCKGGKCTAGGKKDCPGTACKTGICDTTNGNCTSINKPDTVVCVSGKQCSIDDHCQDGECISGGKKPDCVPDAGVKDSGVGDSGQPDSGQPDGGAVDAGGGGSSGGCSCSAVGI